eukprot:g5538.t1
MSTMTRSGGAYDETETENESSGWKSYNNRNAASFGYQYKMDKVGNILVRKSTNKKREFCFHTHPSPDIFFLIENYPTLVTLDNKKLLEIVLSKQRLEAESEESSIALASLKEELRIASKKHLEENLESSAENLHLLRALERAKKELYVEKTSKVKYVKKVDAVAEDNLKMNRKMEGLVQELGELRQTAADYKNKLVENMSLLNLTVAALTKLQELPAHLLKIQQQIDISVENKNYDFADKIKLWNQTRQLQSNVILSDFGDDFLNMMSHLPRAFSSGDANMLDRHINSRIYGKATSNVIRAVLPDGKYTFAAVAKALPITQFDILFKSIKVQTTTVVSRFNKDRKKLLSNFGLDAIVDILNTYGAQLDVKEVDQSEKHYYLYCLSTILLSNKNADLVEQAFEVMEPIEIEWMDAVNGTWRCNLRAHLKYYYRFQGSLSVKTE